MRKLLVLFVCAVFLLAACGGATPNEDSSAINTDASADQADKPIDLTQAPYFDFTFLIPDASSDVWPVGVCLPSNWKVASDRFSVNNSFSVVYKDEITALTFQILRHNGQTDARAYFERELRNGIMKSFDFTAVTYNNSIPYPVEDEEQYLNSITTTAFPGFEDYLSCETSSVKAFYVNKQDDITLMGEIKLFWFDKLPENDMDKGSSFGFMFMSQSPIDSWEKNEFELGMIAKSIVLLPSVLEIEGKQRRAEDEGDPAVFGKDEFELKLLQLTNGATLSPGWDTIYTKYTIGYDEETLKFYLVENIDTPSGLLPHPERPGWTIERGVMGEMFSYLEE
ncbi:MAG TPA: hypothetical protein PKV16_08115 [Caldisericia bacterium]|nr:hypothetical protein [Caldisericia bacterium]HPF49739.1 hypothetical protein [Caldisericia bacterium]HPI84301.1 hypothetical protein [Caldisericia bacterium]HPQ93728.1 hypothetical protein [Caldisericia bacterium]HRV74848.1 hypothetical protein [Caldisericia bacterium]